MSLGYCAGIEIEKEDAVAVEGLLAVDDGLCCTVLLAVAEGGVDADVLVDFGLLDKGRVG